MPTPLTNEQIEELFTQLNASVPHLVMGVLPTPFDCEAIREAFALALAGEEEKFEQALLARHRAIDPSLDLNEGSVMRTLIQAEARLAAEISQQVSSLHSPTRGREFPSPPAPPPPPPPSAEDLVKALEDHPLIRIEVFRLLCRELNYTAIGQGQKKRPGIQQVILDVVGEDPSTGAPNE